MGTKNTFLLAGIMFFLSLAVKPDLVRAQQGSIYISGGYTMMSGFGSSTISINQADLGNSYNMVNVKGDSKTNTPISATNLNYRLGYFYDDNQRNGIELSFDPLNYEVTPNKNVVLKGIINNMFNVQRTVMFSASNGAYYEMTGANLMAINLVKRIPIYMSNTKDIDVAAIAKIGAGPALPHVMSSLPVNPVNDPGLNFAGWNAGAEAGVRVRGYRYIYLELTGRYDYASFNSVNIYDGTARQQLTSYEIVGSIGFTFPTHSLNPLFFREHKIVTIEPFFMNKDAVSRTIPKRKVKYDLQGNEDTTLEQALDSIPEFDEIVDREYKKTHPDTIKHDTTKATWYVDSLGRPLGGDSITANLNAPQQHLSKRELKRKRKQEARAKKHQPNATLQPQNPPADSTNPMTPAGAPPVPGAPDAVQPQQAVPPAPQPDNKPPDTAQQQKQPEELSKKERKRRKKQEAYDRNHPQPPDTAPPPQSAPSPAAPSVTPEPQPAQQPVTPPATPAVPDVAPQQQAAPPPIQQPDNKAADNTQPQEQPQQSKKELKRKEKEDRKERKRKEKEDKQKAKEQAEQAPTPADNTKAADLPKVDTSSH